jgi:hypothetical protein
MLGSAPLRGRWLLLHKRRILIDLVVLVAYAALFGWAACPDAEPRRGG